MVKAAEKSVKFVLLVEDDLFLASLIKADLEKTGIIVQHAGDYDEAKEILKVKKPALVLLDVVFPDKGFGLMRFSREKYGSLPFIVISNLQKESDVKACKDLGACDYLLKSQISIDHLIDKIKALI